MQVALIALCFALFSAAHSSTCKNPLYQSLAEYKPARDFCIKNFPQPAVTVTGSPKLLRRAVENAQYKRGAASTTKAVSTETTTTKTTAIKTTTTKVTTAKTSAVKDEKEILWSSLQAQVGAIVSSVCYCINPPETTTVYPSTRSTSKPTTKHTTTPGWTNIDTSRTTSKDTSRTTKKNTLTTTSTTSSKTATTTSASKSTTPLTTSSTSPSTRSSTTSSTTSLTTPKTTPSTTSPTSSTTSLTTSSTSSCTPGPSPSKSCIGQSSCPFQYRSCSLQPNDLACQTQCNVPQNSCVAYSYNGNTKVCSLYGDCTCPTTCGSDRPSPVQKQCSVGTCSRQDRGCSLQSNNLACQAQCNIPANQCYAYNYNPTSGYCVLYGDCTCPTTCGTDRPTPARKQCPAGTCSRTETGCSLQSSDLNCQAQCNIPANQCIAYNYNPNTGYCVLYGDCTCPTTCGADRPTPAQKQCPIGTCSRSETGCSLQPTDLSCQAQCNIPSNQCIAYNYNPTTGYCVLYGDCTCPTTCGTDRPAPAQKQCPSGTCQRSETGCSLQATDLNCQAQCNIPANQCIAYNYNAATGYCLLYGDCTCPASGRRLKKRGRG